ncbi:MAG: hypothetical protein AAB289_11900, partial [Chloroflexota bacterium]
AADGVVTVVEPAEGQRVTGPRLKLRVRFSPAPDTVLDRASVSLTLWKRIWERHYTPYDLVVKLSEQLVWDTDGLGVTAEVSEPGVGLGSYQLYARINDHTGQEFVTLRQFNFAIPEDLALAVSQRTGNQPGLYVSFEQARLGLSASPYRQPDGNLWTPEQWFGRPTWLPNTAPWDDRVAELQRALAILVWREAPLRALSAFSAVRTSQVTRVISAPSPAALNQEVAAAIPGLMAQARANALTVTPVISQSGPYADVGQSGPRADVGSSTDVHISGYAQGITYDATVWVTYSNTSTFLRFGWTTSDPAPQFDITDTRVALGTQPKATSILDTVQQYEGSGLPIAVTFASSTGNAWPPGGEDYTAILGTLSAPTRVRPGDPQLPPTPRAFRVDPAKLVTPPGVAPQTFLREPFLIEVRDDRPPPPPWPPCSIACGFDSSSYRWDQRFTSEVKLIYRQDFPSITTCPALSQAGLQPAIVQNDRNRSGGEQFEPDLSPSGRQIAGDAPHPCEPVIFVPGIAGSRLVELLPNGPLDLWVTKGVLLVAPEQLLSRLSLDPGSQYFPGGVDTAGGPLKPGAEAVHVIAPDVLRDDPVPTYGSLLRYLANSGYREYNVAG